MARLRFFSIPSSPSTNPAPLQSPFKSLKSPAWGKVLKEMRRLTIMMVGAVVAALGYSIFQVPFNIAAGGLAGLGVIINHYTGWPVGTMYLIMNIPLLVLGYFYLGRWAFVVRTVLAVLVFSVTTDLFVHYLPTVMAEFPVTNDILLSTVYAGIIGGVGSGFVYWAGSTLGGTAVIGRIIQLKTGMPLSQVYLYTDGLIVLMAGIVFGWELALYAMLTLFLGGIASDYTLEGPSSVRTATVITNKPDLLSRALMTALGRGASQWQITGSYTGEAHSMLMCTIYRPQVNDLKRVIAEVDPQAFVTIGVAHQALGSGFSALEPVK